MFQLSLAEWLASVIAGGSVVAAAVVALLLLYRAPAMRSASVYLGLLLFVSSAAVLQELIVNVRPTDNAWAFQFLPLQYSFAIGPLIFAYVSIKVDSARSISGVHFVLPFLQALLTITLSALPSTAKVVFMEHVYAPWYSSTEDVVFTLSLLLYLLLSHRVVRESSKTATYDWKRDRSRWLHRLILWSAFILAVSVFFNLAAPLSYFVFGASIYQYEWVTFLENVTYSVFLYWVSFAGIVQAIPSLEWFAAQGGSAGVVRQERYSLTEQTLRDHVVSLEKYVREQCPHLDSELTLGKLAQDLGITDKVLSFVLNEGLSTTYSDYINSLRVEEARRQLKDEELEHLSVLGLGFNAGFSSKATFNRVFKKVTGMSPSEYRRTYVARKH